jgi:predicted ATP-grasp superfamily ATP-dependent carboligase
VLDDEHSIAGHSRFVTYKDQAPTLREPEDLVAALHELARKRDVQDWVLFPTRDEQVAALALHACELRKTYRLTTPGWASIQHIWDKRNTYRMAEKLGIPIPRTYYPSSADDLAQVDRFPVAVKPAIKEHFVYATKEKAWRADNPTQLLELYERACKYLPANEVMIQDFVPGDGTCQYAYCAFFKGGAAVASLVACRRRQHPLEFGRASTYVETIDLPLLEEYSLRFLREINYYGLVELEFKRDARDGEFRLLDVNGRTWGYHTIGEAAGVDFPSLLFADQMEQPVETRRGNAGVRWIRLLTDLPTGVMGVLSGQLKLGAYLRTLREYHQEAVFSLEDPWPGIVEIALLPYLLVKRGF